MKIQNGLLPFYHKIFAGNKRDVKIKKNITMSFVLKVIDIFAGLIIVRVGLEYLDQTSYGIWLTLSSIVYWFGFVDLGLGHGLRNKLTETLAKGDISLTKKYTSTTYGFLVILSFLIIIVFLIVNQFINWSSILNTNHVSPFQLTLLSFLVFGLFAVRLPLQLIQSILFATQKPAFNDLINTSSKILNLVLLLILLLFSKGSLLLFGLSYGIAPLVSLSFFTIYFYLNEYKMFAPSWSFIDFNVLKNILNLGIKFFLIQISAVVFYSTSNIVITQLFSPKEVTPFQLAHTYFGFILTFFMILITPFWSAITDAYAKDEFNWIKNSVGRLVKIWFGVAGLLLLMLSVSGIIYKLWLGDKVHIPFSLSVGWVVLVALQALTAIFVHFLNGTGKILLQLYLGVLFALLNIPMMIILAKYFNLGVLGVLLTTIIFQIFGLTLSYIQYKKIILRKAYGLWGE